MNGKIFVMRYLPREPDPFYLKTLKEIQKWGGNLSVAAFGDGIIDSPLGQTTDLREEEYYPHVVCRLLELGIHSGWDYVGFMDDDAYLGEPEKFKFYIQECIEDGFAGVGPFGGYRFWCKYALNEEKAENGIINFPPWCTLGMQVYNLNVLCKLPEIWKPMLKTVQWRSDYPLTMMTHAHGFFSREVYQKSYLHRVSNAGTGTLSLSSLVRRLKIMKVDYSVIEPFIASLPNKDFYLTNMKRVRNYELANLLKRYVKVNLLDSQFNDKTPFSELESLLEVHANLISNSLAQPKTDQPIPATS